MIEGIDAIKVDEKAVCARYAKDFWAGIEHMSDTPTGFPVDRCVLCPDGEETVNVKTSPTNIGLYLTGLVAARDLGILSEEKTQERIKQVLVSLENCPTYNGLFFNWYDAQTGKAAEAPNSQFISTVDNAWLAAGLMVVEEASAENSVKAAELIKRMDFGLLFDKDLELFYGGFDPTTQKPTKWHYGVLNTEARIASYVGVARFGIPESNYFNLGRFAPGEDEAHQDSDEFMSWKGGMFEALMPILFVPEDQWSRAWRENLTDYVKAQMDYGMSNTHGFWGFSPCDSPSGEYISNGLPQLGMFKRDREVATIITPHAILLGLPFFPEESLEALQTLEEKFLIYRAGLGFLDSVDVATGEAGDSYLVLDQLMSFLAIANFLTANRTREYFSAPIEKTIKPLLNSLDQSLNLAYEGEKGASVAWS